MNGKNFYEQPTDSDLKRYEEIGKLVTGQGQDYITGCLLNFEHIKNHYKLSAVDLRWQKELDTDPKAIQQIEFVQQLKESDDNGNAIDACADKNVWFIDFGQNQRNETKILSRKCNSLIKDCKLWRSKS